MKIIIGFLFGFCTTIAIMVARNRTGTVGGEILLFPIMLGLAVALKTMRRNGK